ncbi:MAG: peptidoglycan-binding protein, partial [Pseudomonadota bacterium]
TTAEWEVLTGLASPSAFDICLHMTAAIEGHGFTKAVGNFDDAGVTFGIIGFALTGGLPDLLDRIDRDPTAHTRAVSIFGPHKWQALLAAANGSTADKRTFGDRISVGSRKVDLRSDWETAFRRLGQEPSVQHLQLESARSYWRKAVGYARIYQAEDLLDMGLLFDATVQHGSISGTRKQLMDAVGLLRTRKARRQGWANAMADATSPQWRENVRARRIYFANGEGLVHGANYLADTWGFMSIPFDQESLDGLEDAPVTVRPANYQSNAGQPPAPDVVPSIDWLEEVPVPSGFNTGLRSVNNSLMISVFGMPRGNFSQHCKEPTNIDFRNQCEFGSSIPQLGKIWWGFKPALESLHDVMADISRRAPAVYDLMGHAGMGCARYIRGSSSTISNHSWAQAIDITLGGGVDPYNNNKITRGMIEIIPIFNDHKWYSGCYFSREDSMHLEVSRDLLEQWISSGHVVPISSGANMQTAAMLQQGSRGDAVRDLQRKLNQLGMGLVVDGKFGPGTTAAVKSFQIRAGLTPDGIAGPATLRALEQALVTVAGQ